jgi:hypothetical protein
MEKFSQEPTEPEKFKFTVLKSFLPKFRIKFENGGAWLQGTSTKGQIYSQMFVRLSICFLFLTSDFISLSHIKLKFAM